MLDLTKPMQMRNGTPVRFLTRVNDDNDFPLLFLVTHALRDEVYRTMENGVYWLGDSESPRDIINVPPPPPVVKSTWQGWYLHVEGNVFPGPTYTERFSVEQVISSAKAKLPRVLVYMLEHISHDGKWVETKLHKVNDGSVQS